MNFQQFFEAQGRHIEAREAEINATEVLILRAEELAKDGEFCHWGEDNPVSYEVSPEVARNFLAALEKLKQATKDIEAVRAEIEAMS